MNAFDSFCDDIDFFISFTSTLQILIIGRNSFTEDLLWQTREGQYHVLRQKLLWNRKISAYANLRNKWSTPFCYIFFKFKFKLIVFKIVFMKINFSWLHSMLRLRYFNFTSNKISKTLLKPSWWGQSRSHNTTSIGWVNQWANFFYFLDSI